MSTEARSTVVCLLTGLTAVIGVLPFPEQCEQPFHMFFVRLPTLEARSALTAALRARDIHAAFHYVPLHMSAMGQRFGGSTGQCPVAEEAADCLLRLPFYTGMTCSEQDRVIEAVRDHRN